MRIELAVPEALSRFPSLLDSLLFLKERARLARCFGFALVDWRTRIIPGFDAVLPTESDRQVNGRWPPGSGIGLGGDYRAALMWVFDRTGCNELADLVDSFGRTSGMAHIVREKARASLTKIDDETHRRAFWEHLLGARPHLLAEISPERASDYWVVKALCSTFERFSRVLDATTIRTAAGERRVDGALQASILSAEVARLSAVIAAQMNWMMFKYGTVCETLPPWVTIMASDSPDGPWEPVPPEAIQGQCMSIGAGGASAIQEAAIESVRRAVGFPLEKWNALQALRPGALHRRYNAGDSPDPDDLARIESAQKLLQLELSDLEATAPGRGTDQDDGPPRSGFAFKDDHITVLAELAGLDRCVTAASLNKRSGMPKEDRLRAVLNEMESHVPPLVDRPKGPRNGFQITADGRAEMKRRGLLEDPS